MRIQSLPRTPSGLRKAQYLFIYMSYMCRHTVGKEWSFLILNLAVHTRIATAVLATVKHG